MADILKIIKGKLGGAKGVSEALGDLTPQAVSLWKEVPVRRVLRLEELTGIPRHELRPDIFGVALPKARKPSKARQTEAAGT